MMRLGNPDSDMIPSSAKPSEGAGRDRRTDRGGHGPRAEQAMSGAHIDLIGTVRDLEASGIERPQAEAIARAIGCTEEQLATKADLERHEASMKAGFERHEASTKAGAEQFESSMKAEFERFESEMKANFERLESEMKAEYERFAATMQANFERFQAEVKADIASLRAEMYRALWIQGAGIIAIVAALKYLP